jgi:hypothetical protein
MFIATLKNKPDMDQVLFYNKLPFRILLSLIAANCIVWYGADVNFFRGLLMMSYYVAIISSSLMAFLLISWVHLVTIRLDKSLDWQEKLSARIIFQVLLGLIVPSFGAFFLAALYFSAYGTDILSTTYLLLDFPIIIALLVLLNIYYYLNYLFWTMKQRYITSQELLMEQTPASLKMKTAPIVKTTNETFAEEPIPEPETVVKPIADKPALKPPLLTEEKQYLLIHFNNNHLKISVPEEVSYFYRSSNGYWLKTFGSKDYPIAQSLKDIEELYSGSTFFRINRKVIINAKSFEGFIPGSKKGTLMLNVKTIADYKDEPAMEMFTVSEERVAKFKDWVRMMN